jgi:disulfide bond formation protein DsbB
MRDPGHIVYGSAPASIPQDARGGLLAALAMLAVASATILAALAFEHIGGYQPCALCLMQRTPYYVGIPVAAAAAVAAWMRAPRAALALLFAAFAALMLYGAGLGAYHAGVEWGVFEGPAACAPSVGVGSAADMLSQLGEHAPSCTEATWRFLGLSFAGWNVVVSALLVAVAGGAAIGNLRTAPRRS